MPELDVSEVDAMNEAEEQRFFAAFTHAIANDRGEAAKSHLAAGRAIYVGDRRFPGAVMKKHPDGRRQVVTFRDGAEIVLRNDP